MKNLFSFRSLSFYSLFLLVLVSMSYSMGKIGEKISITTASKEAKAEFLKGRDLFERLRATDANQYFKKAHQLDEKFVLAYYYDALSGATAKNFFEQLDKAAALENDVSQGEKLMIMAAKAGASGETKLQEEDLKRLVDLYPKDERALNLLGQFYFGQQNFQTCIDYLKKATVISPDFSSPYNMLGYSYRNLGDFANAEKTFKTYIKLIPDDPNPYDSYAELLLKEGKYNESIKQYEKALSIDPHFVASYLGMASDYNYLGKNKIAREKLNKLFNDVARNDGERRGAAFAITVSYADEGDMENALKEMQKQYEIAGKINDPSAMSADLNIIGNIYFEMGNYDKAKEKYEASLNMILNSNLSQNVKDNAKRFSLYNDARIAVMKNDVETAKKKSKELWEEANKTQNNFQLKLCHEINGLAAMNEKNYKKAVSEFERANLQNPYIIYRIATAYNKNGNKEAAQKHFKKAANFNALNNLNQAFIRLKAKEMASEI